MIIRFEDDPDSFGGSKVDAIESLQEQLLP